jgi:phosphoribosylformimino-5-aminoimidazole carboxamide ribotide isomerase
MIGSRLYPAIDLLDGKCVRLYKGDFNTSKIYDEHPVDRALYFEEHGADYLHVVDLDGARGQGRDNVQIIADIIRNTRLQIQTGGGIRQENQIRTLLESGAERVVLGSIAVSFPEKVYAWIDTFGCDRIVIGADVSDMFVMTHGWQKQSTLHLYDFIQSYADRGAIKFLCTDIALDGTLEGSAQKLYEELLKRYPNLDFIASGGVSNINDVRKLTDTGVESIIIGKAIYEGRIELSELFQK